MQQVKVPIIDAKKAVYEELKKRLAEIEAEYPADQRLVQFEVHTEEPTTIEAVDYEPGKSKPRAVITVGRIASPQHMQMIGNILEPMEIPSIGSASAEMVKGTVQDDTLEISVWALNPVLRDQVWVLLRQVLFEIHDTLITTHEFLKWQRLSGSDQKVDIGKLPRTVYRGTHTYVATVRVRQGFTDNLVAEIYATTTLQD